MFNPGTGLLILKKGEELAAIFLRTLASCKAMLLRLQTYDDSNRFKSAFLNVISGPFRVNEDYEALLHRWYAITVKGAGEFIQPHQIRPGAEGVKFKATVGAVGSFLKLMLIMLHKEGVLLFPYEFKKPEWRGWFGTIESGNAIWAETVAVFRNNAAGMRESRGAIRLLQTGSKVLLTTTWRTVEDISVEDLDQMLDLYRRGLHGYQTPVPWVEIIRHLDNSFPGRLAPDVLIWGAADTKSKVPNTEWVDQGGIKKILSSMPILDAVKEIMRKPSINARSFSFPSLSKFKIDLFAPHPLGIDLGRAIQLWGESQVWITGIRSLETDGIYATTFGRLNFYLFVYLPYAISELGLKNYTYPSAPNQFKRYHQTPSKGVQVRPHSLDELYEHMGWGGYALNMNCLYRYFEDVQEEDLEGCNGVRQPIKRQPAGTSYSEVVKHIFHEDDVDQAFVSMLQCLDSHWEHFFKCVRFCRRIVECRKHKIYFNFNNYDFVPVFQYKDRWVPVIEVNPQLFTFTKVDGKHYYNPGPLRFCLLVRQGGPRGQGAQWLDVRTYDAPSMRTSDNPESIDFLLMNTDKVKSFPFTLWTFNKNIWLLDQQRAWRRMMIEKYNAKGFEKLVDYEGRAHSKWSPVLPVFAHCGHTGKPFSDSLYQQVWLNVCLALQVALSSYRETKEPLVAFIPILNNNEILEWDDFRAGNIPKDKLAIVDPLTHAKCYEGAWCKIRLRACVTTHGGRAAFVTDISKNVPPELAAYMTGQTPGQLIKYNKRRTVADQLENAFNTAEPDVIAALAADLPDMYKIADEFSARRANSSSMADLASYGFVSRQLAGFGSMVDALLKDPALHFGVCQTHICLNNFVCTPKVKTEFGEFNCPECPLAVFAVSNLMAVAAKRMKAFDEFSTYERYVLELPDSVSHHQRENASQKLKALGRTAIAWQKVEMSIWALIKMNRSAEGGGFLLRGSNSFHSTVQQYRSERGSVEDFLESIVRVNAYTELVSEDLKLKMDRATRILMANQGQLRQALIMPVPFNPAQVLASELRRCVEHYDIDLESLVKLVNLTPKEWNDLLLSQAPDDELIKALSFDGNLIRVKNIK